MATLTGVLQHLRSEQQRLHSRRPTEATPTLEDWPDPLAASVGFDSGVFLEFHGAAGKETAQAGPI